MELLIWIAVFVIALIVLIKGADWFVDSSEVLGLALGLSPFIVGVTIVAIGTSLPELLTSIFAVFGNATEIVAANAVGSNIANILLILGLSALFAGKLVVTRSLIDIDLPIFFVSAILFLGVAIDGIITWQEGIVLMMAFAVYFVYSITQRQGHEESREVSILPDRDMRRHQIKEMQDLEKNPKINWKVILFLLLGVGGLYLGSKYVIESTLNISAILNIAPSLVAISAIAVGTSLPELIVSVQAARKGKHEIAVGNIFGSNIFNILIVVGVPSLIKNLTIDNQILTLGIPVMILVSLFFVISGISQRIHKWEGAMYLVFYLFFIGKLFGLI
jgi:cation:H+ antiporter